MIEGRIRANPKCEWPSLVLKYFLGTLGR